jgi:hypothetical protein
MDEEAIKEKLGDYFFHKTEEQIESFEEKGIFLPTMVRSAFYMLMGFGFYSLMDNPEKMEISNCIMADLFNEADCMTLQSDFSGFAKTVLENLKGKYSPEQMGDVDNIAKMEGMGSFHDISLIYEHTDMFYPNAVVGRNRSFNALMDIFSKNQLI